MRNSRPWQFGPCPGGCRSGRPGPGTSRRTSRIRRDPRGLPVSRILRGKRVERRSREARLRPRELLHPQGDCHPRDRFLLPRRSQLRVPDAEFRGLHPEPGISYSDAPAPACRAGLIRAHALFPTRAAAARCRRPVRASDASPGVAGGMTIALRIRRLRLDDYDAMIRLFRVCGLNPRTKGREGRTAMAAQLRTPRNRYLGAFDGARLVGTVFGTHDSRKGWINRLAVDPAYRRRRIASQLVRLCERGLRAQGIEIFAAAIEDSPSMTGVIGVALRPMSNPIETSLFLKYFVFDQSFFT